MTRPPVSDVAHVSFSSLGGAGAVAMRLAAAQTRLGWPSHLISLVETPFPRWAMRHPLIAGAALTDFYGVRKQAQSAFFSLWRRQHAGRMARRLTQCTSIVHLHWLPGFLDPATLFAHPFRARKIIWSVHDFWPFTGGCHYANGCAGFTKTCGNCPQVRRPFQPAVARAFERKRKRLAGMDKLLVVTPSEWARSLIHSSTVMGHLPAVVVPNPVDTSLFSPQDKDAARTTWGIEPSAFVIGVGAGDLRDERKQIPQTLSLLRDWMSLGSVPRSVQVLVFGAGGPLPGWPPEFRFLGSSPDAAVLAEWYNAMDVFVSLSRYETFGNTLAEAAACGVPSICLTGSGMAEVVTDGQTGWHVPSPDELPAVLGNAWANPVQLQQLSRQAREQAVRCFDDLVVARRVLDLYGDAEP